MVQLAAARASVGAVDSGKVQASTRGQKQGETASKELPWGAHYALEGAVNRSRTTNARICAVLLCGSGVVFRKPLVVLRGTHQ
jgi:hypothetical protein